MKPLSPVAPEQRLVNLDILRGFALFGILLVNMPIMAYPFYRLPPFGFPDLTPLGQAAEWFIRLFAAGSFYPAFSFLFGVGFGLQLGKGEGIVPVYRRRLFILLGMGLAHGIFIWTGDILASYALLGFALIPFRDRPDRTLLLVALAGWLFTFLFAVLPGVGVADLPVSAYASVLAEGSYVEITRLRAAEYLRDLLAGLVVFGGQLLALFLLGLAVGRRRVFARVSDYAPWLRGALLAGLVLAMPLSALYVVRMAGPGPLAAWPYALEYFVASPVLGLAYLAGLTLLLERPAWRQRLEPLGAVGRMALSNYLAQSVVGTLIFYGYGLGLYGRAGPAAALALSVLLFGLQVVISRWWLGRYRFGPMEWLWRSLTYGRPQAWRHED